MIQQLFIRFVTKPPVFCSFLFNLYIKNIFQDHAAQNQTVLDTLRNLNISQHLSETMITVGNKIDLVLH